MVSERTRVPVLMTITFASGTTALLESVMRPVSDAFVDCARSEAEQDNRIPARTRILRRLVGQDDLAMLTGKTKFRMRVSFPARLDESSQYVPSCNTYIRAVNTAAC